MCGVGVEILSGLSATLPQSDKGRVARQELATRNMGLRTAVIPASATDGTISQLGVLDQRIYRDSASCSARKLIVA
jgi:hypothetical protein